MGLPKLRFADRERVNKANRLYHLTVHYVLMLHSLNIGWSIENPSGSLMWITKPFIELMERLGKECLGFCFHNCMFGSRRKKMTAIWTSVKELLELSRICDEQHSHDAWGLTSDGAFATAQECAYDPILCSHWAHAIAQFALHQGFQEPPATLDEVSSKHLHVKDLANRAITGCLPRGNKMPPLLTDFLSRTVVDLEQFPFLKQVQPGARLPDNAHFCKGARLLQFLNDQKGVEIGMPLEPLDYIKRACKLVHPNMQPVKLPEGMEEAIRLHGSGSAVELRRVRIAWTKTMISLYNKSREQESIFCTERPEHLKSVLDGKRFALMKLALEQVGYPDASIASEASVGFPLVGWMKESNMFAANLRPPELHVDSLVKMAASFFQAVDLKCQTVAGRATGPGSLGMPHLLRSKGGNTGRTLPS